MRRHNDLVGKRLTLLIGATLLLLISLPTVLSLGVAPSSYSLTYEPGKSYDLSLRIINNEHEDHLFRITPTGDLARYVRFDTEGLIEMSANEPEKTLYYTITPPKNLPEGANTLDILIEELSDFDDDGDGASITTNLNVKQKITLRVPYTGPYLSGELFIVGEQVPLEFVAHVVNRGTEGTLVQGTLSIRGPTNDLLYTIPVEESLVNALTDKKFSTRLTDPLNPGSYLAEFTADYDGKQIELEKTFTVGSLSVKSRSITVQRYLYGEIARLKIDLESQWNRPIQNVYAEVELLDAKGTVLTTFRTASVTLQPTTISSLDAFVDTANIPVGDYTLRLRYFYEGRVSEELFTARFGVDNLNIAGSTSTTGLVTQEDAKDTNMLSLLVILVLVLVVMNVFFMMYMMRKKSNKSNKRK